jgi:hypothetical protein
VSHFATASAASSAGGAWGSFVELGAACLRAFHSANQPAVDDWRRRLEGLVGRGREETDGLRRAFMYF